MERTALFIHGAWMNAECWDRVARRFRERGWLCLTPSWPHNERSVAELRSSPSEDYADIGIDEVLRAYESVIRGLPHPPLLVGHCFGGLFVQLLLARGLGYAGVAMTPAPEAGTPPNLGLLRANAPVVTKWAGHKRLHHMDAQTFRRDWDHLGPEEQVQADFERLVVPTPGRPFFQLGFGALEARWKVQEAEERLPLLVIGAAADRTVPEVFHARAAARWGAAAEYRRFDQRTHLIFWQQGWEEVADLCIHWGEQQRALASRLGRTTSGRFVPPPATP